jgi:hypothetical protein
VRLNYLPAFPCVSATLFVPRLKSRALLQGTVLPMSYLKFLTILLQQSLPQKAVPKADKRKGRARYRRREGGRGGGGHLTVLPITNITPSADRTKIKLKSRTLTKWQFKWQPQSPDQCYCLHTNPTCTCQVSNPAPRSQRPTTKRRIHDTVSRWRNPSKYVTKITIHAQASLSPCTLTCHFIYTTDSVKFDFRQH